jgi:large subunit ribosomal protein L19
MNITLPFAPKEVLNRKDLDIRAGDTVKVYTKIEEKGKTRLQMFQGLVLAVKHGHEPGATFTVRKISNGVGVERIFPLYSPNIDKIEIVRRSKVRRSKLYFLREKVAREIRRKMRNFIDFAMSTDELTKEQEEVLAEMPDVIEETPVEAEDASPEATAETTPSAE